MSGSMLPPAIIVIEGRDTDFVSMIAKDKALLADFAKTVTRTKIAGDSAPLMADLARARTTGQAYADTHPIEMPIRGDVQGDSWKLGAKDAVDIFGRQLALGWGQAADQFATGFYSHVASSPDWKLGAKTAVDAFGKQLALGAGPAGDQFMTGFYSHIASSPDWKMIGNIARDSMGNQLALGPVGSTGKGAKEPSVLSGLLAGLMAKASAGGGAAGGGGAGWASILGALRGGKRGGGSGGIRGFGKGMPAFGSILGMMGFGAEHVATSGIGIAGSLAGGALGGGLLAGGAMGVAGVGMGTDMAGMGQAAGDIKATVQAQNQLNLAIASYGKGSYQAVQAQQQLNGTLAGFPAVARGAILAAANTAQAFHAMFNRLTGPAEKIGAQIIQQAMRVGMAFLPTIGKYAAENMGIIKKDIQPFFAWMTSMGSTKMKLPGLSGKTSIGTGGLAIFQNLEKIFQGQLPEGIKAVTGMLELFAKTIDVAAQYTGGFMKSIAKFATHMNTPKAFGGWAQEIGKLIGLFHSWLDLAGSVAGVLIELFKPALGFGKAFADLLRGIMGQLKGWLSLGGTQSALHNLFSAHIEEVIKGIGGVLTALMPMVESAALMFVKFAGAGARIAGDLLGPLASVLKYLSKFKAFDDVGGLLMAGFLGYKAISGAVSVFKGIATQVGLLPTRIGLVALKLKSVAGSVASFAKSFVSAIASGAQWVASTVSQVAKVVATNVVSAAKAAAAWVAGAAVQVATWVAGAAKAVARVAIVVASNIAGALASAAAWVAANAVMLAAGGIVIAAVVAGVLLIIKYHKDLEKVAIAVWHGIEKAALVVWNGLERATTTAWNFVKSHLGTILPIIADLVMGPIGALVVFIATHWNTVKTDTISAFNAVVNFLKGVGKSIIGVFSSAGTWLLQAGKDIISGLVKGIGDMAGSAAKAAENVGKGVLHSVTSFLGIHSPSTEFQQLGQFIVLGLGKGMTDNAHMSKAAIQTISTGMLSEIKSQLPQVHAAGASIGITLAAGIRSQQAAISLAIAGVVDQAVKSAVSQMVGGHANQLATGLKVGAGSANL